jgi:hypothetical protein
MARKRLKINILDRPCNQTIKNYLSKDRKKREEKSRKKRRRKWRR